MWAISDWLPHLSEKQLLAFGYTATLICVFFSARIAFAFLYRNPRMFTVMALFTCVWMCVLGAYIVSKAEEPKLSDLITDIASFLEVYVGGLLLAEGSKNDQRHGGHISWLQSGALVLLLFIVWPKQMDFPEPVVTLLGVAGLTENQMKSLASQALVLAGFVSVLFGARKITGMTAIFLILALVLVGYEAATAWRYTEFFFHDCIRLKGVICPPPDQFYIFAYAAGKLAYTLVLGCIVAYHGMPAEMRAEGFGYWLKRFFFLVPAIAPAPGPMSKQTGS